VSFYNICNSILETSKLKFIHIIIPDTYGPNDNRQKLIQNIISKIKTQSEMIFEFNGNNKIELCHIQDVVKYFINLLELIPNAESGTSHRLVCEKLKVKEIVKIIENYMNQTLVSTWGENPSPITNFNYRNTNILEIDKPIYLNQGLKSMT
jgi:nucleoside-diphosphate-sugar epimerase